MATEINKFSQLSHSTGLQAGQNKPIQSSPKVAPEQNEETNKTIKYMIGATAIASIIAFGVLSKKGKLGKNVKNALWGTSKPNTVKPNVSSTINDILTPDQKAKSTLANLYQKVIDNANKSGNNRRAGIFEQCKNNIDTLDTKTIYGNLLDALYKDLRLGEYSTSNLITKDIDKITAQSSSLIKVKNAHGWHYRSPKTHQNNKAIDRVSVNALADKNLIKELDDLFSSGKVKGYYKTPDQALNWLERHDPITIYLDEAANENTLDAIKSVCQKYIRSTDDVLLGDKFAPGMALQKSPTTKDIEDLLSQAQTVDPQLENVLRKQFTEISTGNLKTSAGYIEATKKLLELIK